MCQPSLGFLSILDGSAMRLISILLVLRNKRLINIRKRLACSTSILRMDASDAKMYFPPRSPSSDPKERRSIVHHIERLSMVGGMLEVPMLTLAWLIFSLSSIVRKGVTRQEQVGPVCMTSSLRFLHARSREHTWYPTLLTRRNNHILSDKK